LKHAEVTTSAFPDEESKLADEEISRTETRLRVLDEKWESQGGSSTFMAPR